MKSSSKPDRKVTSSSLTNYGKTAPASYEPSPQSRTIPLSWVDFAVGGLAWGIANNIGLINYVIRKTNAYGNASLLIGAIIGCGAVAVGMYGSRAIRKVAKNQITKNSPVPQPEKDNAALITRDLLDSDNQQSAELTGYSLLSKELEAGKRDGVLWLKSFSESEGNEAKAQAAYNRQRARTLADEFNAKQKTEDKSISQKEKGEIPKPRSWVLVFGGLVVCIAVFVGTAIWLAPNIPPRAESPSALQHWEIPITIEGTTYPVRFNTVGAPTQADIDEAIVLIRQQRKDEAAKKKGFQ